MGRKYKEGDIDQNPFSSFNLLLLLVILFLLNHKLKLLVWVSNIINLINFIHINTWISHRFHILLDCIRNTWNYKSKLQPHQSPIHAHFLLVLHHLKQWHRNMPYHSKVRDLDNNSSWFLHHIKNQWYTHKETYNYVEPLQLASLIGTLCTLWCHFINFLDFSI